MSKELKGKKLRGERTPLEWKELATIRGEVRGRQRACVRITYARLHGEVRHSYCFGLEGPDGGLRTMAHISENLVGQAIHLMNMANVLTLVLRLRGQEDNIELAQAVTKRLEGEATPQSPEVQAVMADTAILAKAGTTKLDRGRSISGSAFATIADALTAQGSELPKVSDQAGI